MLSLGCFYLGFITQVLIVLGRGGREKLISMELSTSPPFTYAMVCLCCCIFTVLYCSYRNKIRSFIHSFIHSFIQRITHEGQTDRRHGHRHIFDIRKLELGRRRE